MPDRKSNSQPLGSDSTVFPTQPRVHLSPAQNLWSKKAERDRRMQSTFRSRGRLRSSLSADVGKSSSPGDWQGSPVQGHSSAVCTSEQHRVRPSADNEPFVVMAMVRKLNRLNKLNCASLGSHHCCIGNLRFCSQVARCTVALAVLMPKQHTAQPAPNQELFIARRSAEQLGARREDKGHYQRRQLMRYGTSVLMVRHGSPQQFGLLGARRRCKDSLTNRRHGSGPGSLVHHHHLIVYPLTVGVVRAPQMISQPVSSISPCSPLPSGTWRTPGLSIP